MQSYRKLLQIRNDNGKEYLNSKFKDYFQKSGILHQTTMSHTPQQNNVAERPSLTLVEMFRCMLQESGLPQDLWAEAINASTYIKNKSNENSWDVTPYESKKAICRTF